MSTSQVLALVAVGLVVAGGVGFIPTKYGLLGGGGLLVAAIAIDPARFGLGGSSSA